MNKISKKLFLFFTGLLLFFSITAFIGFSLSFSYYTCQNHERELKERAETIAGRLEKFMETKGPKQGRGAYLRFLDDIAMADAYIIGPDNKPFSYGQHASSANTPTEAVLKFAARVFASSGYEHSRYKDVNGRNVFFSGIPVSIDGQPVAAVVIRDTVDTENDGVLLAISVLAGCFLFFYLGTLSCQSSKLLVQRRNLPAATTW